MYCQHCGNPVDQVAEAIAAEHIEPVEVVLARIEADRAIQVARIEASARRTELDTAETIAETQADAEVAAAVAEAEVVGAAIEAGIEPAPEPMIIDAPTAIADDEPSDAPPEAEGSAPPEPKHKASGIGFW